MRKEQQLTRSEILDILEERREAWQLEMEKAANQRDHHSAIKYACKADAILDILREVSRKESK